MIKKYLLLMILIFPCLAQARGILDSINKANEIIEQTILKQKVNKSIGFQTHAYLKNTLILDKQPTKFLLNKYKMYSNVANHQLIWLFESSSQLYYTPKTGYKELMEGTKSYGKYPSWEFKSAAQMQPNFTGDFIKFESLSDKNFVSPLGSLGFKYYDFAIVKQDSLITRISITPKRRFSPTFKGFMDVDSKTMQLSNLDLKLTGDKGVEFLDTLQVIQKYVIGNASPLYTTLNYKGDVLKFSFSGSTLAYFGEYKLSEEMPYFFRKNEVIKDNTISNHRSFSDLLRPLPLTSQERFSYAYQDSLDKRKKRNAFLDSIDRFNSKIEIFPLLFSELVWRNKNRHRAVIFDPIAPSFFYNTVEGFGINYGVTIAQYESNQQYVTLTPRIRYGISNKELNSDISFSWFYKPKKRGLINVSVGSTYKDLNPNGSLSALQNTLNTLFFEQNFTKLYRKEYASMGIGRELVGNLYLSINTEWSRNYSAFNTNDYAFRDIKRRNFSSNNPISETSQLFPNNNSFYINSSLIYTLKQPYVSKDRVKTYLLPLGPRFIVNYRRGFPNVFKSESNYNFLEFEIQHEKLDCGLWGYGSYSFSTGKFFNAKTVYYPEWKHFSGNLALVFNPGLKSFHLLDFYTFSTNEYFFESHIEHNFNQYFSNKIPLLRKLKAQELLGGAYLYQPQKEHYYELYFGFRRLMFRADYAFSFNKYGLLDQGFKLSYRF